MLSPPSPQRFELLAQNHHFMLTKEYHRFEEFCQACMQEQYIGICYGKPGVGKTLSARHLANWDMYLRYIHPNRNIQEQELHTLTNCNTFFYTTPVLAAPKRTRAQLIEGIVDFSGQVEQVKQQLGISDSSKLVLFDNCKLLIIDEADRLKMTTLEELRDFYDHLQIGMILIGMPGLEKRLSRYPQFYSRIGFAHEFKLLDKEQAHIIVRQFLKTAGMIMQSDQPAHQEIISTIIRITNGNFRLIQRLFKQINRILKVNELTEITTEVVETAKDCLVIGNT